MDKYNYKNNYKNYYYENEGNSYKDKLEQVDPNLLEKWRK